MARAIDGPLLLTRIDRILLTAAQASFPLVRQPFAVLADIVGEAEQRVIERLASLKEAAFLRKIGPVFEPASLGLSSELAAVEVAPSHLESVGAEVATWAPVTHCYARDHRLNLWYAAVAPGEDWFEWAAARAASLPGVKGAWRLPALRRFKIAVHFDLVARPTGTTPARPHMDASEHDSAGDAHKGPAPSPPPAAPDIDILRAAETDLPLCSDPFSVLAASLPLDADGLLGTLRSWLADGRIRRYGALVSHRRLGFAANSMTAWVVPDDDIDRVGKCLASSPHVSHCYQRPAFPGFPYNMYAMIHGRSRAECLAVVGELSSACGAGDPAALFSDREFKKTTPNYADLLTPRASPDSS